MYKLYTNAIGKNAVMKIEKETITSFSFDPANTDYAQFKKAISEETAQLQDAEGNLMTAQAAKDFIKELP